MGNPKSGKISDQSPPSITRSKIKAIKHLIPERVGIQLSVHLLACMCSKKHPEQTDFRSRRSAEKVGNDGRGFRYNNNSTSFVSYSEEVEFCGKLQGSC